MRYPATSSTEIPETRRSSRYLAVVVRRLGLVVLATGCLLPACNTNNQTVPTGPAAPGAQPSSFAFLAGTWAGTWTDTRYNASGSLQATFTVNGSTVTATGVIGLGVLGLGDESGSGSGTESGQTLDFAFSAATVGSGSGSLSTAGTGSGTGTVTGTLNYGAFTFTGTVTASAIDGTFDFTSPTGGNGVARLTKQ
jgi:hypothetical protein